MNNIFLHIATIVLILVIMFSIVALLRGIVNPAIAYALGAGIGYVLSVSLTNAIRNRIKK
jgi:Na+-translocating ferredoxin:NAD+ oxidoreductase RnfA subunit